MSGWAFLFIGLILLTLLAIGWAVVSDDYYSIAPFITAMLVSVITVVYGIAFVANNMDKGYSARNCRVFGEESGYETKQVIYGYWTRECLAKTPSGKWVNWGNVQQNDVVVTNNGDN